MVPIGSSRCQGAKLPARIPGLHVVNFINAFGDKVGLHITPGDRPLSTGMVALCVAITCGWPF